MKAARYWAKGEVRYEEVPVPRCEEGEALIKVACTGICGSDTFIYSGIHPRAKAPLILGHEFSGAVVVLPHSYCGELAVGDKVTVNPLLFCRECTPCVTGNSHVCKTLGLTGIDEDGSFAEYVKVKVGQIVKLPQGMSNELGAIVEPVAVAVHAVRRSAFKAGDAVLVVGGGPIGFLIATTLKVSGARKIFVVEPNSFRRNLIAELGVEVLEKENEAVLRYTNNDGVDVVFEAAGVPAAIETAVKYCKIRGQIVNVGVFKQPTPVDLQRINFAEVDLIGTRVYTMEAFRAAVDFVARYADFAKVITHRLTLSKVQEGMQLMKNGGDNLKILLFPDHS